MIAVNTQKEAPLVSVVVPVYNRAESVFTAVDSALQQTVDSLEVIVVDDGSTDKTPELLQEKYKHNSRVRLLQQKNAGPAAARNTGITSAAGEWIAFLDSDDAWRADKLEQQLKVCREQKVKIAFHDLKCKTNGRTTHESWNRYINPDQPLPTGTVPDAYRLLMDRGHLFLTTSLFLHREVLEHVGLFRENLRTSEDLDLYYRLAARYPIAYVADQLATYSPGTGRLTDRERIYYDRITALTHELNERLKVRDFQQARIARYGLMVQYRNLAGLYRQTGLYGPALMLHVKRWYLPLLPLTVSTRSDDPEISSGTIKELAPAEPTFEDSGPVKLSVIIPCYNGAKTLQYQLEALMRQEWEHPWEVIISDNGSTDSSKDIAASFMNRLPNLRIVDASDKRGAAHARNVGARHAHGEFLAFCDDDDEVAPGWVAAMGEALEKHPFVAGAMEGKKLNPSWVSQTRTCQSGVMTDFYPPYLPHASSGNLGVRRSVHEKVGGFDETFSNAAGEDTDYCWRVQLAGHDLKFVPDALLHYRFRNTLRDIYRQGRAYGESCVYLYKRYRARGMPQLSLWQGIKQWLRLGKALLKIRSKAGFGNWLFNFGMRFGRLHGCIRHRTLAL